MISFFKPAIVIMNRLKYSQKFLLLGILILLPLMLALSQFIVQVNKDINFVVDEQSGIVYITPLADFVKAVQEHMALRVAAVKGDQTLADLVEPKQAEIEQRIQAVDGVDHKLGAVFGVDDEWGVLKSEWAALKKQPEKSDVKDIITAHRLLIQHVLKLITQVGNSSQLVLDPDIDTYYLMDMVITKLPLMSDYLSQIKAYGLNVTSVHFLDAENKTLLNTLAGLVNSNMELVSTEFGYASPGHAKNKVGWTEGPAG